MSVSVVLISYNQEKYIQQAVESLLMQRFEGEIEVIVADDSSQDTTLSRIQELSTNSSFHFVFLPKENNLGHPKNYKRAFNACSGDYVAILEGDDYWTDPFRLQKHVDFLDTHRECVMSMNRLILFEEDIHKYSPQEWYLNESYEYISGQRLALGNCLGNLSACVIRKTVLDNISQTIFDLDVDDWLLGMSLTKYGLVVKLKDIMSVYRIHSNGQWSGKTEFEVVESLLIRIEKYNNFLEGIYKPEFDMYKQKLIKSLSKHRRLKDYIPPFLYTLLKLIIPPVFIKKDS